VTDASLTDTVPLNLDMQLKHAVRGRWRDPGGAAAGALEVNPREPIGAHHAGRATAAAA
jgi:hypothetical protein